MLRRSARTSAGRGCRRRSTIDPGNHPARSGPVATKKIDPQRHRPDAFGSMSPPQAFPDRLADLPGAVEEIVDGTEGCGEALGSRGTAAGRLAAALGSVDDLLHRAGQVRETIR